jgi:hypothetical protein
VNLKRTDGNPPDRPVAAPLDECADLLGIPVDQLAPIAAQVEPYEHADGHPVWSLFLLERQLHPERFGRRRRRRGGAA